MAQTRKEGMRHRLSRLRGIGSSAAERYVKILPLRPDYSLESICCRQLADEGSCAEQLENYLGYFIAAADDARISAEGSGWARAVGAAVSAPFADDHSGGGLQENQADIADVEILIE